jgi:hypothetical protein
MQQPENKVQSNPVSRSIVSKSQSIAQSPAHTMDTVAELENRQPKELSLREPEPRKPGIQVSKSSYERRGLVVGVAATAAARETLREMDREL